MTKKNMILTLQYELASLERHAEFTANQYMESKKQAHLETHKTAMTKLTHMRQLMKELKLV